MLEASTQTSHGILEAVPFGWKCHPRFLKPNSVHIGILGALRSSCIYQEHPASTRWERKKDREPTERTSTSTLIQGRAKKESLGLSFGLDPRGKRKREMIIVLSHSFNNPFIDLLGERGAISRCQRRNTNGGRNTSSDDFGMRWSQIWRRNTVFSLVIFCHFIERISWIWGEKEPEAPFPLSQTNGKRREGELSQFFKSRFSDTFFRVTRTLLHSSRVSEHPQDDLNFKKQVSLALSCFSSMAGKTTNNPLFICSSLSTPNSNRSLAFLMGFHFKKVQGGKNHSFNAAKGFWKQDPIRRRILIPMRNLLDMSLVTDWKCVPHDEIGTKGKSQRGTNAERWNLLVGSVYWILCVSIAFGHLKLRRRKSLRCMRENRPMDYKETWRHKRITLFHAFGIAHAGPMNSGREKSWKKSCPFSPSFQVVATIWLSRVPEMRSTCLVLPLKVMKPDSFSDS